jgi:phosphatidylserine/phosphatidylglycerophosphate/cardiolipin synthase-like enzyme
VSSGGPPTGVLGARLEEAIAGRGVKAAVFTTFCFDPGFFEQEVLSALFQIPLRYSQRARTAQLESALLPLGGKVAVFYDQGVLLSSDLGSAALDVARIPVRRREGYFHPKCSLVLVEDERAEERLVVLTSSANLTKPGWWDNVECAHVAELRAGRSTRMADELREFLRHLRRRTRHLDPSEAVTDVLAFLEGVPQSAQRTWSGRLHTHFHASGRASAQSLDAFLADNARGMWGWNLDVISPYFDDAERSLPLERLVSRFGPEQVRVSLPEAENGEAALNPAMFDWLRGKGWQWGRLPAPMTRREAAGSSPRAVHAKVLRFYRGKREIVYIGSANLTGPGHSSDGNVEAGVLVERTLERKAKPWLEPLEAEPRFTTRTVPEDSGDATDSPLPLVLRYNWEEARIDAIWEGSRANPALNLSAGGVPIVRVEGGELRAGEWCELRADVEALELQLRSSSLWEARYDDGRGGFILVMEVGMAQRPSILGDLTRAEILELWSALSAEQRAEVVARFAESKGIDEDDEFAPPVPSKPTSNSMFDRFAGMFHAFAALEQAIHEALDDGRFAEAKVRAFGAKPDSLPRLVTRVLEDDSEEALVDNYVLLLCAYQVERGLRAEYPEFWRTAPGRRELSDALGERRRLRDRLAAREPGMAKFLRWHERHFLRRAKR